MRDWNIKPGDPLTLTLAADARLGGTDYCNDQIWELQLGSGEPPAVALHTTYGLRARSQRLFPRFTEGDHTASEPVGFKSPPVVRRFYPNYLHVHFIPLQDIDVDAEYWVPDSHAVAGRLSIRNAGRYPRQIQVSWVALLAPNDGQRMAPAEVSAVQVLTGSSEGLVPVVFITGGPRAVSSPYPALVQTIDLAVGETQSLTWSHAALGNLEESFDLARRLAARSWDAEIARIELLNAGQIELHTGNPDWDIAFALAQKVALSLAVGPASGLPAASFVLTRQPDQGFSRRGDGSDYNYLWNGQPVLDAYYLSGFLLPAAPQVVQGWVENYLATRAEDGSLDWKPGLAGQRGLLMATPLVATLAWRAFQLSNDLVFLEGVYQKLFDFLQAWFTPRHDRDGDGVPEWDHPMQAGFEDHPVFSRWQDWAQGLDISTAESPALCTFLYRECRSLIQMAARLNRENDTPILLSQADVLRTALEASWNADQASYLYRDRDTHLTPAGEILGERTGPGELMLQCGFDQPERLFFLVTSTGETTLKPHIIVYGENAAGQSRVEHLSDDRFRWYMGRGVLTTERVYRRLDHIEIQGIHSADKITVSSAGYCCSDMTNLAPLWAGIPEPERAEQLVRATITQPKKYWREYGLPACPAGEPGVEQSACSAVQLYWNTLIGEGLLSYGYQDEAAELVTRLMKAVVINLKETGAFYRSYHAETGRGMGERNALSGLAPQELFLETLGVRPLSPFKVFVNGFNPFPWPVTVKYRGLSVLRRKDKTIITFPDGYTATVKGPAPQIVSHEME